MESFQQFSIDLSVKLSYKKNRLDTDRVDRAIEIILTTSNQCRTMLPRGAPAETKLIDFSHFDCDFASAG